MIDKIEQRIKKNLISELKCLSASELENVVCRMMSVELEIKLLPRGTNADGRPVGYTVDVISQDSSIAIECSVEKNYFSKEGKFKKIQHDIDHAEKTCGKCLRKLFLVSNQEENPSFRKFFSNYVDALKKEYDITIYSAREVSEKIYSQSKNNDRDRHFYEKYCPNFGQEFNNYAYYGRLPGQCANYYVDNDFLRKIDRHFDKKYICVLYGVSGAGKTQASIAYIHYAEDRYDNYIWVGGDDWKKDTSLSCIDRFRGGTSINVAGIFNQRKTILIIDNLNREIDERIFSELQNGIEKGGRILVTSQLRPLGDIGLQMDGVSERIARSILGEDRTDSQLVCDIIEKCRHIPIVLSMIRKISEENKSAKNELYQEVIDHPEAIENNEGASVIQTILSKLPNKDYQSLVKVANSGVKMFDIDFLRYYCGQLSCVALQKHSLLMDTCNPNIVKIHELVCKAVKNDDCSDKIANVLEQYMQSKAGEMTPSLLRQTYLMKDVLKKHTCFPYKCNWLTYGFMQIEGSEKDAITGEISKYLFQRNMSLSEVMCLIESKELVWMGKKSTDEKKECLKGIIDEFKEAISLFDDGDEKIVIRLRHHLGKAYRRFGEYEKAFEQFKKILETYPDWYAGYVQIMNIHGKKIPREIKDEIGKYVEILFHKIIEYPENIPLRQSLQAISRGRSYKQHIVAVINTREKVAILCNIVAGAALDNIGQFFEGFVSLVSMFGYHYGDMCVELAEKVPDMIMVSSDMVDKMQWLNACEALTNIAVAAKQNNKMENYSVWINQATEFARAYLLNEKRDSFGIRVVAKTYNISGNPSEALNAIALIPEEKRDHWILYRQAEAESMLRFEKAIKTIEKAISLLDKTDYMASYLHMQAKCYEVCEISDKALASINDAIKVCNDEKYKSELKEYKMSVIEKIEAK